VKKFNADALAHADAFACANVNVNVFFLRLV